MIAPTNQKWPYPGSRWWKFDFHTHTPASLDTSVWQNSIGSEDEVLPKTWLLKFMASEIDCVAVTDHNSGDWIDKLKSAYEQMKEQAENGVSPDGFRELVLFPGVELSVHGGFHLLALFDPSSQSSDIDTLLGSVGYDGTKGDSDAVTRKGAAEVVQAVVEAGGLPIPAHADRQGSNGKGLLAVRDNTRACQLDANTVRQVLETEGLLAVEWEDSNHQLPEIVEKQGQSLSRVIGSDCHDFEEQKNPGSRYTWIKMANPTLEGLRLALLDGNNVSVRRSDEGTFEPFQTPSHFITKIKIDSAQYMGNGNPISMSFTPYYNALIGGRGTGKSTVVQALRLAYRRDGELDYLGETSEPYRQFKSFTGVINGRESNGALRQNTKIFVELMRNGVLHKLCWCQDGQGTVIQEQREDGEWNDSSSQTTSPERFPVRLFSQGQIAAMAGDGRQALLSIIDEAAQIGDLHRAFEEAKGSYFSKRARLRELDGKLKSRPELERKLEDAKSKLDVLAQSHHAEVLQAHQQAQRQGREVDATLNQLRMIPNRIETLAEDLLLDDWQDDTFDSSRDHDVLTWRNEAEQIINTIRAELTQTSGVLSEKIQKLEDDSKLAEWRKRVEEAQANYEELQSSLIEQGVEGPQAFGRLVHERQEFEEELKHLNQLKDDRQHLEAEIETQWIRVADTRKAITRARAEFLMAKLEANNFVSMEIIDFGFDANRIEHEMRDLLDVQDERFSSDILQIEDGEPVSGLAFELANAQDSESTLKSVKVRIIEKHQNFGGYFQNYLRRKFETPEFVDHVQCWFPEDDLHIKYSRTGDGQNWSSISQSSQGQRSAALLAFMLAFGDEPLILDQPEDDLDNHLIYELIVRQIRENKLRRQLIVVTHNPNVVINGDAEMIYALDFRSGQCKVAEQGALQEQAVREEVCQVMEGGREAFARRWARLGREV